MAVSVRTLTVLLTLTAVVLSAVTSSIVAILSADDALDSTRASEGAALEQTRQAAESATESCFGLAEDSVMTRTRDLLQVQARATTDTLIARLNLVTKITEKFIRLFPGYQKQSWGTVNDWDWWWNQGPTLWAEMVTHNELLTAVMAIGSNVDGYPMYGVGLTLLIHEVFATLANPPQGYHAYRMQRWGTHQNGSFWDIAEDGPLVSGNEFIANEKMIEYNIMGQNTKAAFQFVMNFVNVGEVLWSPMLPLASYMGAAALATFGNNTHVFGAIAAGFDINKVSTFLTTLRMGNSDLARTFLVVRGSWAYERLPMQEFKQFNDLVGTSHGRAYIDWYDEEQYRISQSGGKAKTIWFSALRKDINATDPITRATARHYYMPDTPEAPRSYEQKVGVIDEWTITESATGGGWEEIIPDSMVSWAEDMGGEATSRRDPAPIIDIVPMLPAELDGQRILSSVSVVHDPLLAPGIDWYLVQAIDRRYALGAIDDGMRDQRQLIAEETAAVSAVLDKSKQEVEDQIKVDRRILFVLIIVVCLFIILVSVFVALKLTAPLKQIGRDMSLVAKLRLDEVDTEKQASQLHEYICMHEAFLEMHHCIVEYRSYLPQSLLEGLAGESDIVLDPPKGSVAIVFTDIVSSTAHWQRAPDAMNTALETHNRTIRAQVRKTRGYEVKTIGDAFMVSFDDPVNAAKFGLGVQADLVAAEWPEMLGMPPREADSGGLLWHGLCVRIGSHVGEAILEENPLTGRADYRGTPVNTASRVEAKARAGTLCVTSGMWELLGSALGDLGDPSFADAGEHELKGLAGKLRLIWLVPKALKERLTATAPKYETTGATAGRAASGAAAEASEEFSRQATGLSVMSGRTRNSIESRRTMGAASEAAAAKGARALNFGTVSVLVVQIPQLFGGYIDAPLLQNRPHRLASAMNLCLGALAEACGATHGVVEGVFGGKILCTWNAAQPSAAHAVAALHSAALLRRRCKDKAGAAGVAAGSMLHGNVGTNRMRFHTVFGQPLSAAERAAQAAEAVHGYCCSVDCTTEQAMLRSVPNIAALLRPVDVWRDNDGRELVCHDVDTHRLLAIIEQGDAADCDFGDGAATASGLAPPDQCRALFDLARSAGGSDPGLRALSEQYPKDHVLGRIAARLAAAGTVAPGLQGQGWLPGQGPNSGLRGSPTAVAARAGLLRTIPASFDTIGCKTNTVCTDRTDSTTVPALSGPAGVPLPTPSLTGASPLPNVIPPNAHGSLQGQSLPSQPSIGHQSMSPASPQQLTS